MQPFRVGVTPDFYVDAKGRFEHVVEAKFAVLNLEWEAMPEMPGNHATPEILNRYDAVFALSTQIDARSPRGRSGPAILPRWGLGHHPLTTESPTAAAVVLTVSQ